jgi:peptidoglycan hydrolase-like protein with peptidoglycan-binding domain
LQQFHGSDVVQLKIILHALGYYRAQEGELRMELSAPFFTQEVVNAVNAFRDTHELSGPASGTPPGLVDAETIELMWEDLDRRGIAGEVRRRIREMNRGGA